MEEEKWGFHYKYPNYAISTYGRVYSYFTKKFMKPQKNEHGYLRVNLIPKNKTTKESKYVFVHKLVLETFVGKRPKNCICRHYPDQDKTNNFLNNISWDTNIVNAYDRIENNTFNCAKLTEEQVIEIKQKIKNGENIQKLIKEYKISEQILSNIKNNNIWKNSGEDISKFKFRYTRKKLTPNDASLLIMRLIIGRF